MRSSDRIRKALNRYQKKPVTQQGILGNEVGVIAVPNRTDYVYVRVAGLGTISVYNKRVPLILDLPVDVGYDPLEPKNFQVLNIHRYPQGGGRGLVDIATILHGKTHNWTGIDPVFIEKRQLMPLRPTPIGGMGLYITREVTYYDDKAVSVTGQQFDLTPYIPTTGSWLVLLYKDTDEIVKVSTGGVLKDIFSLSLSDAPQAYPGTVPIALIRLYGGQSGIAEGYNDTDLIDVRQLFSPIQLTGTGGTSGGHVIQDEGTSRPQRTNLNFKGALVWANDNAGADSTDIVISGSSSGVITGSGGAPTDAKYLVAEADGDLSAEIVIPEFADRDPDTPSTIPGLCVWLEADNLSGYSNNDTLVTWLDASGWGHHFIATGGTPKYKTNIINSLPAINFDGSSWYSGWFPGELGIYTLFFLIKFSALTPAYSSILGPGIWTDGDLFAIKSNGKSAHYIHNALGFDGSGLATYNTTDWNLITIVSNATTADWRKNKAADKTAYANGSAPLNIHNQCYLGRQYTAGRIMSADLSLVLMYKRNLTSVEVETIEGWINTKYALGL